MMQQQKIKKSKKSTLIKGIPFCCVLIFCFFTSYLKAQGTFILKIRAEQTEDILEDEKGGIWVTADNLLVHYSGFGKLIDFKEVSYYGRLKYSINHATKVIKNFK